MQSALLFSDESGGQFMRLFRAAFTACISVVVMAFSPVVPAEQAKTSETEQRSELPTVDEMIEIAGELMDVSRWDEAIQIFTLALEIEPNNGLAHAGRALAYGWTNRLDEASRDLAAAEKGIPGRAIIHRVRAIIADRRSDEETQLYELSKSLELEPDNPMALRFRAWILHRRGKEAEALADAEAYIRARPQDPDAYALKADLLRAQHKRDLAAEEAKHLATLFPGNDYATSTAARIYAALGDRTRALQEITSAINENPDVSHYYKLRAKFRRWDDVAGRRKDLEAALALQPNDLGTITEMAVLDFQQQRWSQAIANFSIILTLEPKDYGVMAYRAMAREKLGDKQNAARDFDSAMAAASGAADFDLICEALAYEGVALDRALNACNRAIELNPDEGWYRNTRGLVELRLGRIENALADFDFAIADDNRLAHPFYGRALARWRKGDRPAALEDLKQARSIAPDIDEKYRRHGFTDLPDIQSQDPQQAAL